MSTSAIPLFGRAWKLSVRSAAEPSQGAVTEILTQNTWEPEALRMTFEVLESALPSPYWYADISIFNLNDPEIQNLLFNAAWATLEAGYQTGPTKSSIIWDGPILQVLFDRDNVVDSKVTLHCIASIPLINENTVNFAQGPFSSQLQLVSRMVAQIGGDYAVNTTAMSSSLLSGKQYPRGKTVFGKVSRYLYEMANDNFLATWNDGKQSYLSEMDSGAAPGPGVLVYSPPNPPGYNPQFQGRNVTSSVLGVPKQTPFGVIFTVLLDPRLIVKMPPLLVQLDRTVISQQKAVIGQFPTPLDPSLIFVAAQVRHYGDSRGNDWCTEVTGYTRTYGQGLLNGLGLANASAAQ